LGTLIASLNIDKSLSVSSECLICSGENLTTNLLISIPSSYLNYDYYLEFHCPDDNTLSTSKLDLTEGSIIFTLPYEIIKKEGRVDFQVVAKMQTEDLLVFKSSPGYFAVNESINADSVLSGEFLDVITECEQVTQDAIEATADCLLKTSDVISATAASISATQASLIATADCANKTFESNQATSQCIDVTADCITAKDLALSAAASVNNAIAESQTATLSAEQAASNAESAAASASCAAQSAADSSLTADSAAQAANEAVDLLNLKIQQAEGVIIDTVAAKDAAVISTFNADSAAASANEAALHAENAAQSAQNASASASSAATLADSAAVSANSAAISAISAANNADNSALSAQNASNSAVSAAASANQAAVSAEEKTALMQSLYDSVLFDVNNHNFDGKSAYEYAVEGGYQGTETDFYGDLSCSEDFITESFAEDAFASSLKAAFEGSNVKLSYCRPESKITDFRMYSDKTIQSLPEEFIPDYVMPTGAELTLSLKQTEEGLAYKSISIPLLRPLTAIEGSKDEIVYDENEGKYYAVYRNEVVDFSELNWVYDSGATPNVMTACYVADNFTRDINADLYYECGSFKNIYAQDIFNHDFPEISIFYISTTPFLVLRISRDVLSDTALVNQFFSEHSHKMIIKLQNEIRVPLSDTISDEIKNIILSSPDTFIDAQTQDNNCIISGNYNLDSKLYIDSKAKLSGDNELFGNQKVNGNIEISGNILMSEDVITLRNGKAEGYLGEGTGIIVKSIDGVNDGKILINCLGQVKGGLSDNLNVLAERETVPTDKAFTYWDNTYKKLMTSPFYKTTNFLKLTTTDDYILSQSGWVLSGSVYEYQITYYMINENALVMVNYEDSCKEAAVTAGINKYNPVISGMTLTLKADSVPESDLTVKLIIIGV